MTEIVENPFAIAPGTAQRGHKRVRAYSAGELVVDTRAPLMVWEHPSFPQYFVTAPELVAQLRPAGTGPRSKVLGVSEVFDVVLGDRVVPRAVRRHPEAGPALRDAYGLTWSSFDTWLEEDEVVHTHPRSPYVRIDALASSRHVVVTLAGTVVADSRRPVVLYETGLVPRYYLPRVDVRMDLLVPTSTVSHCPYKGSAAYWDLVVPGGAVSDVAWSYPTPLPESTKIAGLVAFWPEKSPELHVTVDGEEIGRQ